MCIQYEDMLFGEYAGHFLHLKLGDNGKAVQIACSQSRNASLINHVEGVTPIENFDIDDKTELWNFSKHRLGTFLKQRKKEDEKLKIKRVEGMRQRQKVR